MLDYKRKCNKVASMLKKGKIKVFQEAEPIQPKTFEKVTKYLTKKVSSIPILKDCDGNTILVPR